MGKREMSALRKIGKARWRSRAFTLTELIVVLALMSAIAAYALTNVLRRRPADLLDRVSTQLASDLAGARMRAVSECRDTNVTFSDDNRRYVIWSDRNTNGVADDGESEVRTLSAEGKLSVWMSENPCVFSSRGCLNASGWRSVWFSRVSVVGAGRRYVYVLKSGQVRWTKSAMMATGEYDVD
jgi:prepilin-type N-terminal cleavage/methylation domain-containing protein